MCYGRHVALAVLPSSSGGMQYIFMPALFSHPGSLFVEQTANRKTQELESYKVTFIEPGSIPEYGDRLLYGL